jgi:hypothetical protein
MNDITLLLASFVIEVSICIFLARQVRSGNALLWSIPFGAAGLILLIFIGVSAFGFFEFRTTGERKHLFSLAVFAMGFFPFLVITALTLGVSIVTNVPRRISLRVGFGAAIVIGIASLALLRKILA